MNFDNMKAQMRKGVLELCIMSIIANQESYPSDIIKKLKEAELIVVEGTLYPLLSRLKKSGFLSYSWKESPSGPPRKYFSLTPDGYQFLNEMNENWNRLVNAVNTTTQNSNHE